MPGRECGSVLDFILLTMEQLKELTKEEMKSILGGMPPGHKVHCVIDTDDHILEADTCPTNPLTYCQTNGWPLTQSAFCE